MEKAGDAAAAPAGEAARSPLTRNARRESWSAFPSIRETCPSGLPYSGNNLASIAGGRRPESSLIFVNVWRPLDANPNGIQRVATSQSLVASFRAKVLFRNTALDLGTSLCVAPVNASNKWKGVSLAARAGCGSQECSSTRCSIISLEICSCTQGPLFHTAVCHSARCLFMVI